MMGKREAERQRERLEAAGVRVVLFFCMNGRCTITVCDQEQRPVRLETTEDVERWLTQAEATR
jgi:hypothetical protein